MKPLRTQDFFLPTEENQNVPHFLSRAAFLIYFLVAAFILFSPFYLPFLPLASLVEGPGPFQPREIVSLVNKARAQAGVQELNFNDKLAKAAESKAKDMFEKQYFSHNTPEGLAPWEFIRKENYNYRSAGENLAINYFSASDTHQALMNSPSHRENLLNSRYSEIGVSVLAGQFNGRPSVITVQFFGKQQSPIESTPAKISSPISAPQPSSAPAPSPSPVIKTSTPGPYPSSVYLKRGNWGDEVTKLQEILARDKSIYPEGLISGFYGELTEKAVVRFQKKYGITPTGFVGPMTSAKLTEFFSQSIAQREPEEESTLGIQSETIKDLRVPLGSLAVWFRMIAVIILSFALLPLFFLFSRQGKIRPGMLVKSLILILGFSYILSVDVLLRPAPMIETPAGSISEEIFPE